MTKTTAFLSKNFISRIELVSTLDRLASKKNLEIREEEDDILNLHDPVNKKSITLYFITEQKYNSLKKEGAYIKDYSSCFYIWTEEKNDTLSIPFMKGILDEFPEMVVYIDENIPRDKVHQDYVAYTKDQLDQFNGTDLFALVSELPPSDLA
jgi:hypothetical protein